MLITPSSFWGSLFVMTNVHAPVAKGAVFGDRTNALDIVQPDLDRLTQQLSTLIQRLK